MPVIKMCDVLLAQEQMVFPIPGLGHYSIHFLKVLANCITHISGFISDLKSKYDRLMSPLQNGRMVLHPFQMIWHAMLRLRLH